jgi:hypothetical protein
MHGSQKLGTVPTPAAADCVNGGADNFDLAAILVDTRLGKKALADRRCQRTAPSKAFGNPGIKMDSLIEPSNLYLSQFVQTAWISKDPVTCALPKTVRSKKEVETISS